MPDEHMMTPLNRGICVAMVSGKGGVGKTVLTAGIGAALARAGKRTVCVDCSAGLRALDLAMGLTGQTMADFTDVAAQHRTLGEALIQHPEQPGLYLIHAPAQFPPEPVTAEQMRRLTDSICSRFDFCLLDVPSGLDNGFTVSVNGADRLVIVTGADPMSLRNAQRTVMEAGRFPAGSVHILPNRIYRRLLSHLRVTVDDMMDTAGAPLLGLIPEDHAVPRSLQLGLPVTMAFPLSGAARACRNVAARLTGIHAPLSHIPW